MSMLRQRITRRQFRVASTRVVAVLLLLSAGVYVLRPLTDLGRLDRVAQFFDVGVEGSLPTFFSTFNLLVGAVLALLAQRGAERYRRHWGALSLLLAYLAVDEACQLHERVLPSMLPELTTLDGEPMLMPWVPFALAAVLVIGGAFVPFLLGISRRTAIYLVVGGAVFVLGAAGLEVAGHMMLIRGIEREDSIYIVRRLLEEALELYGVVIVNLGLFGEVARRNVVIGLELTDDGQDEEAIENATGPPL